MHLFEHALVYSPMDLLTHNDTQGLVKSKITDVYWKMVDLRLQVNKARLGMSIDET